MKQSETARKQVVDYVRQEICRHGVNKLTMDDIARGMRVSKRTLYQLFPQKTCLIWLCLSDIADEARGALPERKTQTAADCVQTLFRTLHCYIGLLHTYGSTMLADIAPDTDYRSFIEWEQCFWTQRLLEAFNQCKVRDCLLPFVEPASVAENLIRIIFDQCRYGAMSYTEQRMIGNVLLRGFFRLEEIGCIDVYLASDRQPV